MASNELIFKVQVTDSGTTIKAVNNVNALGDAVSNTGKRHRDAEKAAKGHYNEQEKGVIGTANSARSFSKLAQTMEGGGGIVGAYATLAANIFAVTAAFNALRGAAQVEQVFQGLEAAGARLGRTLSVTAEQLKAVTDGAISTEEAMRTTAQVTAAGFSSDAILKLGQVARDTSFALGRSMTDSMERLTRGIVKLEPELLDELGIMTKIGESNAAYAAALGKTEAQLTNFEKRQGFLNAVLAEGELKFGGLADQAGNTTSFDKLAATFSDLTKDIFNFINVVAKPLASVFAATPIGLTGLMLLLGSTISSQLLPGLNNLSKGARESATRFRELAKGTLVEFQKESEGSTKALTKFANAVEAGKATSEGYQKALKSVNDEIRTNDRIAAGARTRRKAGPFSEQEILAAQGRKELLQDNKKALEDFNRTSQKADVRNLGAMGIENASIGSWKEGLGQMRQSVSDYSKLTDAAGNTTSKLSTAMYAVGQGTQFAAASFFRFLPYIGLITVAIGLLQAAFEMFKSEGVKKAEAAMKEFNTVLDAFPAKMEAFNRINTSTASIASRTEQAIILQANAVNELAASYAKANAAQVAADKESGKGNGAAKFYETFNDKNVASYFSGIAKGSEVLAAAQDELASGDDRMKMAAVTLEDMAKIAPKTTSKIVELHGGWKAIGKLNSDQKLAVYSKMIGEISEATGPAAERVKALTEAMKNTDLSIGKFLRGFAQSTAFDDPVNNLRSLTSAITDLQVADAKGEGGEGNWQKILAGIGPEMARYMDDTTMALLKQNAANESIVQTLKERLESTGTLTETEQRRLKIASEEVARGKDVYGQVLNQIRGTKELYEENQKLERTLKAQTQFAQAALQANQKAYEMTAAGVGARIDAENKLKDLQIQGLKARKALVDASIAQNLLQAEELKKQLQLNEALSQRTLINDVERKKAALDRIDAAEARYREAKNFGPMDHNSDLTHILEVRSKVETALKDSQKRLDGFVLFEGINDTVDALRDSSKALSDEIKSIMVTAVTGEQRLAAMASKSTEIYNQRLQVLTELYSLVEETTQLQQKAEILSQGRTVTLADDLRLIKDQARVQREQLNTDISARKASLEAARGEAAVATATDAAAEQARSLQLEYYDTEIRLLHDTNVVRLDNINAQEKLNLLEKAAFDTRKEGLTWQQESLNYLEKSLSVQKELNSQLISNEEKRARLDLKRRGLESTEAFDNTWAIKRAEIEVSAAKQSAGLRKSMIDLEYALLDAQRTQLQEDLRARRTVLTDVTQIAQLDSVIQSLENAGQSIPKIIDAAKRSIDESITSAELDLLTLATPKRRISEFAQVYAALEAQTKERQTAEAALLRVRQEVATKEAQTVVAARKPENNPVIAAVNPIIESNNLLRDRIKEWIVAVEKARANVEQAPATDVSNSVIGTLQSNAVGAAATSGAKAALDFFISKGWTVNQSAGIVGNLQQESTSKVDPKAINRQNGIHYGIAQWSEARAKDFFKVFGKSLYDSNFREQLEFLHWELTNSEKKAGNLLRATTTAEQAAISFRKDFERPASWEAADDKRIANTRNLVKTVSKEVTPQVVAPASTPKVIRTVEAAPEKPYDYIVEGKKPPVKPQDMERQPLGFESAPELTTPQRNLFAPVDLRTDNQRLADDLVKTTTIVSNAYDTMTAKTRENLLALGPQGEMVLAVTDGMMTISSLGSEAFRVLSSDITTTTDKITAVGAVLSAAISSIQSFTSASAQAKIDNIEREIAAEQKRDGKSAESLAKIQAMEKRKDQIAKKQFNLNKKMMMAQAVIATAVGITQALTLGPIAGPIMAAVIAAMGAAQLAIISGTTYQSTSPNSTSPETPSTLSIGKRSDTIDVAKQNRNVGGELGYLRGADGRGRNSGDYSVIGSAYGGALPRGYGNTAYAVGEKGPEIITPETPITVTPISQSDQGKRIDATFNIHAIDSKGVAEMLEAQNGNIIAMLRRAANANGQSFLEDVDTNVYTRPQTSRL